MRKQRTGIGILEETREKLVAYASKNHLPQNYDLIINILIDNSNGSPNANSIDPNELPFIDPESLALED